MTTTSFPTVSRQTNRRRKLELLENIHRLLGTLEDLNSGVLDPDQPLWPLDESAEKEEPTDEPIVL